MAADRGASESPAGEEAALAEIMNLLQTELEPSSGPAGCLVPTAPGPDIPALREQLAVLVSTGKGKEAIGVQLTHEQVKRLSDKDVEKYTKRYETYVGSKTTESLIDSFIFLATKVVGMTVKNQRHRGLPKRAEKRLHLEQRALQSGRQPFFEVRPVSCRGQRGVHHHETY